ncbi:hypothetical protein [Streptomyces sp. CA2R106]|uniref:hypothetical protein n=1 Tax=Streptomyces sp. CA2R106 TaxID=3120153 RepID=UPI0030082DDF
MAAAGYATSATAAAVVAAALMLTGCSGGGSSTDAKKEPTASRTASLPPAPAQAPSASAAGSSTPSATGSATASANGDDVGGASTDSTQTVEGVWLATVDGVKVQLVLGKGKAALTSDHMCGGSYTDKGGVRLTMTCMDGDKERTSGQGEMAADGKTLTVQWKNGQSDTFTRTGLPSS